MVDGDRISQAVTRQQINAENTSALREGIKLPWAKCNEQCNHVVISQESHNLEMSKHYAGGCDWPLRQLTAPSRNLPLNHGKEKVYKITWSKKTWQREANLDNPIPRCANGEMSPTSRLTDGQCLLKIVDK